MLSKIVYPEIIIGWSVSVVAAYGIAYARSHAKVKALEKSEAKKQEMAHKLNLKLEQVKATNVKDFETKKHQYESRKSEYYSFLDRLDSYNEFASNTVFTNLSRLMMEFFEASYRSDKVAAEMFTVKFNRYAQEESQKFSKSISELYSQSSKFKLSASEEVLNLLDQLQVQLEGAHIYFNKTLEAITNAIREDKLLELKGLSVNAEKSIKVVRDELIMAMRNDLNKM